MNITLLLFCLSIPLLIVGIWAFFWALKSGQMEDLTGDGQRILMEEEDHPRPTSKE